MWKRQVAAFLSFVIAAGAAWYFTASPGARRNLRAPFGGIVERISGGSSGGSVDWARLDRLATGASAESSSEQSATSVVANVGEDVISDDDRDVGEDRPASAGARVVNELGRASAETGSRPPEPRRTSVVVPRGGLRTEESLGLDRAARRRVQAGLGAVGFFPGTVDGMFGRQTRAAVRDWQAAQGVPATGYLDAESATTLMAMGDEALRREAVERAVAAEETRRAAARGTEEEDRAATARAAVRLAEPAAPVTTPVPDPALAGVEIVVPAESYIQVQVDIEVSSATARVEDDVQARVSRDVVVGDRVVIPAGAVVLGSVTRVTTGGRFRASSRLGFRFHTVVFGDGATTRIRSGTIYRESSGEGGDTARKVGVGAAAGAVIGGLLGGGRGAATGAAVGTAGGTAAAAADSAAPATLAAGEVINLQLIRPATFIVAP